MAPKADTVTTPLASVGIDIGKDVFHVVAFGTDGKIAFRWKIKRLSFADAFKKLPPCIIGIESMPERALRQQDSAGTWARAADHPGDLCQTFREGTKERLQRC